MGEGGAWVKVMERGKMGRMGGDGRGKRKEKEKRK